MAIAKFDSKASWSIAMACAFLNVLALIPTKVSGLFFVEILDRYQVNRNIGGYPAFTLTLVRCSGGPFAGYFAQRFGLNEVMTLGSLLTAIGISACFFAEDIAAVTVCLGLIHGIGLAFINTFFPQIVTIHFRKHRTLAFGITNAGAYIGSFLSPPLLVWIFKSFGTSGGFLIVGAMVLNCLPIVLILNILSPNKLYNKSAGSIESKKYASLKEMGLMTTANSFEGHNDVKTEKGNTDSEIRNELKNKSITALILNGPTYNRTEVMPDKADGLALNFSDEKTMYKLSMIKTSPETERNQMEHAFAECERILEVKPNNSFREKKMTEGTDENIDEMQYNYKEESIPVKLMANNSEKNKFQPNNFIPSMTKNKLNGEIKKDLLKYRVEEMKDCYTSKDSVNTPVNDVPTTSNLIDQEWTQKQLTRANGKIILTSLNVLNARSLESNDVSNQEDNQKNLKIDKKLKIGSTNEMKSLRIFLDATFWIVIITQSFNIFVLVIFWTTMIDFSRDKNIDRSKEVYFLMALPLAEIIGSLGLSWITDSKYLSRINFSILSFIMMGCSCSLMAWAQEFYVVMTSIVAFGMVSSCLTTVFPGIIFEFFDSSNQTMGQAAKYCLFGPLSFFNGPLIGYFRGTLGSYVLLFHTIGLVSVACAALSTLIPVLARIRDEHKKKRKQTS